MRDAQANVIHLKDYQVPEFLINSTQLNFDLYDDHAIVNSRLSMVRNDASTNKAQPLVLNGVNLELLELAIDGRALDAQEYTVAAETLTLHTVPDAFELSCTTKIYPHENKSFEGLFQSQTMFCTQCEAQGFRKITYYLDRPDVMSVFEVSVEADKQKYPVLLSNGDCQNSEDLADGRHRVQWLDPHKKPCYLFALVAGDLECVRDQFTTMSGRCVDLEIYVEEKDLDKCAHAMRSLKAAMRWDEEVYGREYDLDVYMIVAVDDFNMGAMENKGLNIFNTAAVLANPQTTTDISFQRVEAVVAHEYFHNWSGNRVTCRDWFQLSLKEGFTVYRDAEFSADMNSRGVKRIENVNMLRSFQFPEDAGPTAHPIRPASFMEISNFYTLTIYEKGAEVVRMLAHLLGPKKFRTATDLYFERFDGQAVTCDDFVAVMQEVSGQDLSQFKHWYSQAGTPEVTAQGDYDASAKRYTLTLKQSCRATPETPEGQSKQPFVIPIVTGLVGERGEIQSRHAGAVAAEHVLVLDQPEQRFVFEDVQEQPTPSLLRGFSAPVKLRVELSAEQLLLLWKKDTDPVARWDAGQQLALRAIKQAVTAIQNDEQPQLDSYVVEGMQFLLDQDMDDKSLLAEMLSLPNEKYLFAQYKEVDVHAIHAARKFYMQQLGEALNWKDIYADYHNKLDGLEYSPTAQQIALRRMKNLALHYLMQDSSEEGVPICAEQFNSATNMTDSSIALRNMVHSSHASAQALAPKLLEDFYERWQHEPLVVNLWLQIQAANPQENTLAKVEELFKHAAFDQHNPNKIRSVIGVFSSANAVNFHRQDGSGYEFLAAQIIRLDKSNPQVASRLLTPLTRWRNYPPAQAQLMQESLRHIGANINSRDVAEQVNKSLK